MLDRFKTVDFDNGGEFSDHAKMDEALDPVSYFAYPFSSWRLGSSEKLNGLAQQ